jgi:Domain of unknown function (DUF4340)
MNFRGLSIAVLVLAVLTGVFYWSQHRKTPEESAAPPASTAPVILKVNAPDVTQLTIKRKGADPVEVKKTDGKWAITGPKPFPADQEAVTGILSTLSLLNADRVVEEKASDPKQYGLEAPAVEVDITGKGTRQLLLGDDTPAGGDVYAGLAADARVFTISSYNKTSLDKSLNDLRDKSLLTVEPDNVSRVELIKKGQEIEFDRTKDGWQMLKPSAAAADSSAVNDLVRSLTSAKMDLSAAGDAAAGFAKGTGVGTAKLTGNSGVQTLEVRKDKDDYYAKSSAVAGTYKVDSFLGQALDKKPDDFVSKKKS